MNIISLFFAKDKLLHNRSDGVMKEIMCPLAERTIFSKGKFALIMCDSFPLYSVCSYESNITSEAPKIKFYSYVNFTSYSIHRLLGGGSLSYDLYR